MNTEKTIPELLEELKAYNRKKAEKQRALAKSKTDEAEKKREAKRAKRSKELAKALTKSLPDAKDINPNQGYTALRLIIAKAAFISALENGVLFADKDGNTLQAIKGEETLKVMALDLEEQAASLVEWAKLGRKLNDDKDKPYDKYSCYHGLMNEARSYRLKQERLKSSEEHLAELVEAMSKVNLDTTKAGFNSTEAREEIINKTVATGKKLGKQFTRDRAGNLYLICADQKYSATKLDKKKLKPFFQSIMDNSQLAGKFKSSNDVDQFVTGFANSQPKVKRVSFREKEHRILL